MPRKLSRIQQAALARIAKQPENPMAKFSGLGVGLTASEIYRFGGGAKRAAAAKRQFGTSALLADARLKSETAQRLNPASA